MNSLPIIIKRFLTPKRFKQNFEDKVRNLVNSHPVDWDYRSTKCAKSVLAAVCFRETALASQRRQDSMIYQPIGLYYSMFHMSIAMLWLNPRIPLNQLSNIHHKALGNLVENELVKTGFVDSFFHETLIKLRGLRESCNYQFGYTEDLGVTIRKAIKETDISFDKAFHFIHQVLNASDSLFRVQVGIADGFGDDILDSYLTEKHKEKVFNYLVRNGLSA
jgi:uncharacterized protein (UPF0332 family)